MSQESILQHNPLQALMQLDENVGTRERMVSAIAGGTLLALAAGRNNWAALPLGLLGGSLVFRGLSGHCEVYKQLGVSSSEGGHHLSQQGGRMLTGEVKVQKTVTINATPERIYSFWRKFENLPHFTQNLISVNEIEPGITRWVAYGPGSSTITWDAKIEEDTPNQRISWSTLPGSTLEHNGSLHLTPTSRGTEVRVVIRYYVPGGKMLQNLIKLTGDEPGQQIDRDMRHLKALLETGEIPRTDGQPTGVGLNIADRPVSAVEA